ncbi:MAG: EscU/YscU/HrcU family type III secretion system export apparatus switch protein [Planctomycetota bacterium]|nr:EscU/YscU/HrcU family type III secretion system export apparatus switch protein [Planctomycetota bacterium]
MFSDWDQRTEKPTEARRRLARQEGRVALSHDLVAAFSLLWVFFAVRHFGGPTFERVLARVRQMLEEAFVQPSLGAGATASLLRNALLETIGLLAPLLLMILTLVLVSSLAQSGWIFRPSAVSPNLGHLSPLAGFSRVFSRRALITGLFALLICAWLAGGLYWAVSPLLVQGGAVSPGRLLELNGTAGLHLGWQHLLGSGLTLIIGLIVLGMFDWFRRKWELEQELMMTKEELQEELARQQPPEIISRKRRGFSRRLVTATDPGRGGVE